MRKKAKKEKSTFWKDFKAFISRGNIVDLAVAVVVGAAFTAIVNSVVNDVIKPLIALLVGGNFSELVIVLREATIGANGEPIEAITLNYGNLIMAILTFLIDALVIFTVLRVVRNAQKRMRKAAEELREKIRQKEADKQEEEVVVQVEAPAAEPAPAPAAPTTEELLAEIRDLLKEQRTKTDESDKK